MIDFTTPDGPLDDLDPNSLQAQLTNDTFPIDGPTRVNKDLRLKSTSGSYSEVRDALETLRRQIGVLNPSTWCTEFDLSALTPANQNVPIYAEMLGEATIKGVYVENLSTQSVAIVLGQGQPGRILSIVTSNHFKVLMVPDGIDIINFTLVAGATGTGIVRIAITNQVVSPQQGVAA